MKLKVIGGTLGAHGSAVIGKQRLFVTVPDGERRYAASEIESMDSEIVESKEFSVVSFILGAVLLGALGAFFFSVVGLAGGVVLAAIGSRRKSKDHVAHVAFADGNHIALSCTPRAIKQLFKLRT